jgi:hypothetical protein
MQAYSQNEKILDNRLIIGRIALDLTWYGPIDDEPLPEPIDLASMVLDCLSVETGESHE